MSTRLIAAYGLIALMIAGAAIIVWWNVHHSRRRTHARERARRHEASRLRDKT